MESAMESSITVSQTLAWQLGIGWSRTTRLANRTTATTITPLDRRQIDHPATDKDQQQGC